MSKVIKVKLDENNYFEHVIRILQAIPPFDKLRSRELEVYSRLLFYYNELSSTSDDSKEINKQLFSYEMRRKIEEELKMSDDSLRNNLTMLRHRGVLDQRTLKNMYVVKYGEDIEFKFV